MIDHHNLTKTRKTEIGPFHSPCLVSLPIVGMIPLTLIEIILNLLQIENLVKRPNKVISVYLSEICV